MFGPSRLRVLFCLVPLLITGSAWADLSDPVPELGDLQQWAIFSSGSSAFVNNSFVDGDVAVAGAGTILLRNRARIYGDLYFRSTGTLTTGRTSGITGTPIGNADPMLDDDVISAMAASNRAAFLTPNFAAPTSLSLGRHDNFTVTGGPGQNVVLSLTNFVLTGSSTFTLQGTATTTFIINVSQQFALSSRSAIVLSGGVQWNDVLFNITGQGRNVSLSGSSSLTGIVMAPNRTVQLSGRARITGEVIAGRVTLSGSASITHPPIVSP